MMRGMSEEWFQVSAAVAGTIYTVVEMSKECFQVAAAAVAGTVFTVRRMFFYLSLSSLIIYLVPATAEALPNHPSLIPLTANTVPATAAAT